MDEIEFMTIIAELRCQIDILQTQLALAQKRIEELLEDIEGYLNTISMIH